MFFLFLFPFLFLPLLFLNLIYQSMLEIFLFDSSLMVKLFIVLVNVRILLIASRSFISHIKFLLIPKIFLNFSHILYFLYLSLILFQVHLLIKGIDQISFIFFSLHFYIIIRKCPYIQARS